MDKLLNDWDEMELEITPDNYERLKQVHLDAVCLAKVWMDQASPSTKEPFKRIFNRALMKYNHYFAKK